jgi:hypothetical protein
MKRWLVEMCRQAIATLDATKWGKAGLVSFARLCQLNTVITDTHAPADLVEEIRSQMTEVVLVLEGRNDNGNRSGYAQAWKHRRKLYNRRLEKKER